MFISCHYNAHFMSLQCSFHVITMLISCHYNVHFMSLKCSFHVITMLISCHYNAHFMSLQCSFHVIIMFISCHYNAHFMSLQCSLHVIIMFISCHYNVHFMSLKCSFHVITMFISCHYNVNFMLTATDFVNRFYELRNIAVGKATEQSSTLTFFRSSYANNGNINCIEQGKLRWSSTNHDLNPYWEVDLNRIAVVLYVTVTNRNDGEGWRINPFDIRVGNTTANGGLNNSICVSGATLSRTGEMKNFTCPETEGRYVSIHLSRKQYLQLCEVEVYGIYL